MNSRHNSNFCNHGLHVDVWVVGGADGGATAAVGREGGLPLKMVWTGHE